MDSLGAHKYTRGDFTSASARPNELIANAGNKKGKRKRKGKDGGDDALFDDLTNAFRRTKTGVHEKRGSIYIPKKAKGRQIDVSGARLDQASDRDEDELELKGMRSIDEFEGNKFSLK